MSQNITNYIGKILETIKDIKSAHSTIKCNFSDYFLIE